MATNKDIEVMGVRPVHPGRGEASFIEMALILRYLKGEPVATVVLPPGKAVELIAELGRALSVTAFKET